ncbi:methyltransferase domain-containing protein [Thermogemmatispora sp.]|uniref:methyltransferase domain-containing protein n=1 Tax=Thermogemmatispora sp. TaxID=1968838 RepID=UPI0035E462BC
MAEFPFSTEEALRSFICRYYQENLSLSAQARYCERRHQGLGRSQCTCYRPEQLRVLPEELLAGACCCGNPLEQAELKAGESVLDLGCGVGLDLLLAAQQVQPGGIVYGLDMNEAALERAEAYRRQLNLDNVRLLRGLIEELPLAEATIDVIISNCAINLVPDKERALREAYRVLKPGGRLAIADTVLEGEPSDLLRREPQAWAACLTGSLSTAIYRKLLAATGFSDITIELAAGDWDWPAFLDEEERQRLQGRWLSALIRARKPAA